MSDMSRVQRGALIAGIVGLALCLVGAFFAPRQLFQSYLFAYVFWLGISLGGMAIVMLHHLTGGGWGFLIRRPLEAATRTLPLLVILFIPLLFGLQDIYVWMRPEVVAHDLVLQQKSWYLNLPFFLARAVIYFIVWLALAYGLNKGSSAQDSAAGPALSRRLQRLSAGGLLLYGLTVTFASFDWIMSLTPHWYSTTFGFLVGIGQMLAATAFAIVCAFFFSTREPLAKLATPGRFQDLGNLLLTFVLTWAYLAFTQYLVVWAEDLPDETPWYVPRVSSSWQWVAVFLIVFHFAVPFFVLLSRRAKRTALALAGLAAALLFAHLVDVFWLVVPSFRVSGFRLYWTDFASVIGIGGVWLTLFLQRIEEKPLVPVKAAGAREAMERA